MRKVFYDDQHWKIIHENGKCNKNPRQRKEEKAIRKHEKGISSSSSRRVNYSSFSFTHSLSLSLSFWLIKFSSFEKWEENVNQDIVLCLNRVITFKASVFFNYLHPFAGLEYPFVIVQHVQLTTPSLKNFFSFFLGT